MADTYQNSRRKFIRSTAGTILMGSMVNLPEHLFAREETVGISILHTNDVHSHIDPFDTNHPRYAGQGGVAVRSSIINQIRKQEENVLLFDAGDIFQGTPYFNLYGGELELKLMSMMRYDGGTLGNHDFDNGLEGLKSQLHHAKFPIINCNYDFKHTSLEGNIKSFRIYNKGGLRIGVTGVGINLKGLLDPKMYQGVTYYDPVDSASRVARYLKTVKKCDLVICLSHLGFSYKDDRVSDLVLARKSDYIDLIIGGHTHTFLDEAAVEKNQVNNEVLVTQAGWAGLRLGRIDYLFERRDRRKKSAVYSMKEMRKSSEK
jgi:5'-nucleotidase